MTDLPQSIARLRELATDVIELLNDEHVNGDQTVFGYLASHHTSVMLEILSGLDSRATAPVVDEVMADIQDAIDIVDMCLPMGPIDHRVDAVVGPICKRLGYGAVMASASRQWRVMDNGGAFISGPCVSTAKGMRDRLAKALVTLGQGDAQAKETK